MQINLWTKGKQRDKVISHGEDSQRVSRVMHGLYLEEGDQDHTLCVDCTDGSLEHRGEEGEENYCDKNCDGCQHQQCHDAGCVSSSCDIRRQAFDLCGLSSA